VKICSTFAIDAPKKAPTLLRGNFENCIKRTANLGFSCIEPQLNLCSDNIPDWGVIKKQCDEAGINIAAYATGSLYTKNGLSFISPDDSKIKELIDCLQLYINAAKVTGGKLIIGCVRGNIAGSGYSECEKKFADGLKKLLSRASDAGVTILIEAINRYENDYLATAAQLVGFIEKYSLKGLEILLDTFHMNIEEKSFLGAFKDAAKYLGHIHTSDNTRRVPGSGSLPWQQIIQTLREIGYNGALSFEAIVDGDENSEALQGLNFLKGIIDKTPDKNHEVLS
jgi:sugar phosphate isomerase/epimerase